jgi:hypothetical protein
MTKIMLNMSDVIDVMSDKASPSFDDAALHEWWVHQRGLMHKALEQRLLTKWRGPDWVGGLETLNSVFGIGSSNHCFAASPHLWARFHEPQITGGLAHFLGSSHNRIGRSRAIACLKAVWGARAPSQLEDVNHIEVKAEEGRIDLSIMAIAPDGRRIGTVIEAKFGHKLTKGQLSKYVSATRKQVGIDVDRCLFVVVAPFQTPHISAHLSRRRRWEFLSWWRFLSKIEEHLPAEADDAEFRQFRRTIWKRAYGA